MRQLCTFARNIVRIAEMLRENLCPESALRPSVILQTHPFEPPLPDSVDFAPFRHIRYAACEHCFR